jgi:hypothetical protein
MGLTESQLETWSKLPDSEEFKKRYDSVKAALSHYKDWPTGVRYDVYLQGSYSNATNIKGDSDVDVVVQLQSTYQPDDSRLTAQEVAKRLSDHVPASYQLADFRKDVLAAMRGYFGADKVIEGNKSIKLYPTTSSTLYADVVVCMDYREYTKYPDYAGSAWYEGIVFWETKPPNRKIVNFPKYHRTNGETKNGACRDYKATVRIFKNANREMESRGQVADGLAPSYFLECLIYNAPNGEMTSARCLSFVSVISWYLKLTLAEKQSLWCANLMTRLFGTTPEQWDTAAADKFMSAALSLYTS